MKRILRIIGLAVLVFLQSCSLQPAAWTPQEKPELTGAYAENDLLTSAEWIDLEGFAGPEDIAVGPDGYIYTSVHPVSYTHLTLPTTPYV